MDVGERRGEEKNLTTTEELAGNWEGNEFGGSFPAYHEVLYPCGTRGEMPSG